MDDAAIDAWEELEIMHGDQAPAQAAPQEALDSGPQQEGPL